MLHAADMGRRTEMWRCADVRHSAATAAEVRCAAAASTAEMRRAAATASADMRGAAATSPAATKRGRRRRIAGQNSHNSART